MRCPHCNQEHPANAVFCPLTGKKIPIPDVCSLCGKPVDIDGCTVLFRVQPCKERPALDQQVHHGVCPPAAYVETEPLKPTRVPRDNTCR